MIGRIGVVVLGAVLLVTTLLSLFVVDETQQVVITQFGRPVGEPLVTPGLKLKWPWQEARFFDKRYLAWDGDPNQFPTKEKVYIWVDSFARWRIVDGKRFLERVQNETTAQSRLDGILDGATRDIVARHNLIELVRSTNRDFAVSETQSNRATDRIEVGRAKLAAEIVEGVVAPAAELGIEVLDVRFKSVKYREDVEAKVFDRMKSERHRIAQRYRSEGGGEAAEINGERERDLKQITSEAYRQAEEIKGRADAEAADIYAEAYNRDPEFYAFVKSMEVLEQTMTDETTLLLGTDGEFMRYLEKSK